MGGTRPWNAPETQRPLPVTSLKSTDIYSLGLLIWLVSIDGENPFDLIVDSQIQDSSRADEIEGLKQSDKLIAVAQKKEWVRAFMIKKISPRLEAIVKRSTQTVPNSSFDSTLKLLNTQYPNWCDYILTRLSYKICQETLMRSLDDIFDHSLRKDPETRDLEVIISLLESDETAGSVASYPQLSLLLIHWTDIDPRLRRGLP